MKIEESKKKCFGNAYVVNEMCHFEQVTEYTIISLNIQNKDYMCRPIFYYTIEIARFVFCIPNLVVLSMLSVFISSFHFINIMIHTNV